MRVGVSLFPQNYGDWSMVGREVLPSVHKLS
jgi:hypothetical protein